MNTREQIINSYNLVADDYAKAYCDELEGKPFDRQLLKRFARGVPRNRRVCDLGCGPGHIAEYLRSLGVGVFGIDLSPEMISLARRLHPSIEFQVGDMLGLELPNEYLGGIVAFYSIIHIERDSIDHIFKEMFRVLTMAGGVVISFHRGKGDLEVDEWFGKSVSFRCTLFEPDEIVTSMEGTGFIIKELEVRKPYDFEYPTERVYISAKKPRKAAT